MSAEIYSSLPNDSSALKSAAYMLTITVGFTAPNENQSTEALQPADGEDLLPGGREIHPERLVLHWL